MSAAERMRRLRERKKAAGLKPVVAWVASEPETRATYSSHRLLEARSLAMHAVVARKIERVPSLLGIARRNVERWSMQRNNERPAWLDEWCELLNQPWETVAALITEPSENGARLRQSSPFAGILTQQERRRIYEAFRA
jgi:acyl-CoA reductase-like NAD-dependent aldehyde dehydrogenase